MPGPHLLLDREHGREMRRTTDSRAPNETEREADQAEIVDRCGEVPNAEREKSNHQESRFMIASITSVDSHYGANCLSFSAARRDLRQQRVRSNFIAPGLGRLTFTSRTVSSSVSCTRGWNCSIYLCNAEPQQQKIGRL